MKYQKPPLTFDEQINLLIERGLEITDKAEAIRSLQKISYYRLSAYFIPFKQNDKYKAGSTFNNIINLYSFDQKLRLLVLEAMEQIEVALRTHLIYYLSHKYGAFGYLDPLNFSNRFKHASWIDNLQQTFNDSTETFIIHFRKKYATESHLPIWMALELVSFGGLSRLFGGLQGEDQQEIANQYGITDRVLISWLHTLVYLRNICAHYSRLWNRTLTFKPKLPIKQPLWRTIKNDRIYCPLTIIQYLISEINPELAWNKKLITLLNNNPQIPPHVMGFPANWFTTPLWDTGGALQSKKPQQTTKFSNTPETVTS